MTAQTQKEQADKEAQEQAEADAKAAAAQAKADAAAAREQARTEAAQARAQAAASRAAARQPKSFQDKIIDKTINSLENQAIHALTRSIFGLLKK